MEHSTNSDIRVYPYVGALVYSTGMDMIHGCGVPGPTSYTTGKNGWVIRGHWTGPDHSRLQFCVIRKLLSDGKLIWLRCYYENLQLKDWLFQDNIPADPDRPCKRFIAPQVDVRYADAGSLMIQVGFLLMGLRAPNHVSEDETGQTYEFLWKGDHGSTLRLAIVRERDGNNRKIRLRMKFMLVNNEQ